MVKAVGVGLVALLFGPAVCLLGVAVLFNPAAQASCLPPSTVAASVPLDATVGETARVVHPLPSGTWVRTSGFGIRVHPITGEQKLHTGVDFAAPAGTHILTAANGRVAFAGPASGYGNLILIEHTVNGQRVASGYAHMFASGVHVSVGDTVAAGQHIGDVGSSGYSTGAHLHFEIRPGGAQSGPVDPEPWLAAQGAVDLNGGSAGGDGDCSSVAAADAMPYSGTGPDELVDDPTTGGKITRRTAHVLAQLRANFPRSSWACWADRPGHDSEHELGRACDGTFGNSIGHAAIGEALDYGWQVTNWLKDNARTLGVEYLIWQGRIWSVARADEGWRKYDGGGMYDPSSVTGGHFDHAHLTCRSGP